MLACTSASLVVISGLLTAPDDGRCGVHSLYCCLRRLGDITEFDTINGTVPSGRPVVSLAELEAAAQGLGYRTYCRTWSSGAPTLIEGKLVAVLPVRLSDGRPHFVAALDASNDLVLIADFPFRPGWISQQTLRRRLAWSGAALHIARDTIELEAVQCNRDAWPIVGGVAGAITFLLIGMTRRRYFIRRSCDFGNSAIDFADRAMHRGEDEVARKKNWPTDARNRGMSIIEILVVLGLLSVLLGLLLPAVHRAREAARSVACRSRLSQIGLALQSYASSHGDWIPPALEPVLLLRERRRLTHRCSIQAQLLPYLDRAADWTPYSVDGFVDNPPEIVIPEFLCPSDGRTRGAVNYRACNGTYPGGARDPRDHGANARRHGIAGLFGRRLNQVTDGLSNTAFFSERVQGDRDDATLDTWRDRVLLDGPVNSRPDDLVRICATASVAAPHFSRDGTNWAVTDEEQTLYTHILPPNSRVMDCSVSGTIVASARSFHPGHVGVLFGDGSVRAIGENIDIPIWRAFATPNASDNR